MNTVAPAAPASDVATCGETKRLSTAAARLALRGATLIVSTADDGLPEYIVTLGPRTRSFGSIASVEILLDSLEGKTA